MAQEARIRTRINAELKSKEETILSGIGIKPSQAITMFYTQIARQGGIPFDLKIPNDETVAALQENLTKSKKFQSVNQLMADLRSEDDE